MLPSQTLCDHTGRAWQLDARLAEGGEGAVFRLAGDPALLAKLYTRPPSPQTVEKLRWMVQASSPALRQFAAWPGALLHERAGGPVVGFLMPCFAGYQPVHHLYNPAQRLRYFPRADWAFLVRAARNCAAAFEEVHRTSTVVGDINQSNILVSAKALIGLIDCDSFQVQADGRQFLCEVGVPHYTPPELQRQNFRGLVRTLNHDRFGLAVLLFQLLFLGRHPYAGRHLGTGDPSFEQLIQEFRFAYGAGAQAVQMERPPHTLALSDVSPQMAPLVERAFTRGSEVLDARPTASEWLAALEQLQKELRACPQDPGHKYPGHLAQCPWCRLSQSGGPNYFRGVAAVAVAFVFDAARLAALTARLQRLAFTAFTYDRRHMLPTSPVAARAAPAEYHEARTLSQALATVTMTGGLLAVSGLFLHPTVAVFGSLLVLVFGLWWLIHHHGSPRTQVYRTRRRARRAAEHALSQGEHEWQRVMTAYASRYDESRRRLDRLLEQCRQLETAYQADRQRLERDREGLLREHHLRNCFLADADIPGIGPGRQQVLASYGIETAFDAEPDRILAIKGFGEKLTGNLMTWKQQMLATFRFDPKTGAPEDDLRVLALKYKQLQENLLGQLERGIIELEKLTADAGRHLRKHESQLRILAAQFAQAEADLAVLSH